MKFSSSKKYKAPHWSVDAAHMKHCQAPVFSSQHALMEYAWNVEEQFYKILSFQQCDAQTTVSFKKKSINCNGFLDTLLTGDGSENVVSQLSGNERAVPLPPTPICK